MKAAYQRKLGTATLRHTGAGFALTHLVRPEPPLPSSTPLLLYRPDTMGCCASGHVVKLSKEQRAELQAAKKAVDAAVAFADTDGDGVLSLGSWALWLLLLLWRW